jgi:hypothetical protein
MYKSGKPSYRASQEDNIESAYASLDRHCKTLTIKCSKKAAKKRAIPRLQQPGAKEM